MRTKNPCAWRAGQSGRCPASWNVISQFSSASFVEDGRGHDIQQREFVSLVVHKILRGKDQLHINNVEPAIELETDSLEVPDFFKVKLFVQGDSARLLRINSRDDGAMAKLAGADDQLPQNQRPDPATLLLMMNVN